MREVQTKPKGRGGRWETTPKISAASPEIGTWPSVSQAEGRVGVLAVLGIRCGWEKDASDPNHNVGAAGGDTRTPSTPPGSPSPQLWGCSISLYTPGQAHSRASSTPGMGPKSQSETGLVVLGPDWGQAVGLHLHPLLPPTTLQPEEALGASKCPQSGALPQGWGQPSRSGAGLQPGGAGLVPF